jgi:LemA protein
LAWIVLTNILAMQRKWIVIGVVVVLALILGGSCASKYNRLVSLDQKVKGQWAQVQNAYQRRADLIPNLVETVKGAANFEKDTYVAVTEARARAGQAAAATTPESISDPAKLKEFEAAQSNLANQLSRLMVTVERYPDLKATQNFRDLQAQLEGTENRITVERQRFNEASQEFNTVRQSFPMNIFAGFFGSKFAEKAYFAARAGSETPPPVKF